MSIDRMEFPPRMVLRHFLRILPISTHYHVNIFIVVDKIKLNRKIHVHQLTVEEA